MIKLIISDLDATLLLNGSQALTEEAQMLIPKLQEKGIIFAAASGRQLPNLKRLFGTAGEKMAFICENGAFVVYHGEELYADFIDRELGIEIMRDIYGQEGCEVLLSGKYTSYLQPKTEAYEYRMSKIVKNTIKIVEDITKVEEPFLKISAYYADGVDAVAPYFLKKWGKRVQGVVSGKLWIDFTKFGVNKGHAIQVIQERLGITKEETMAFGDYYNDLEMFEQAYYSYAMTHAREEIKAKARYETDSVESVLKRVLQQQV